MCVCLLDIEGMCGWNQTCLYICVHGWLRIMLENVVPPEVAERRKCNETSTFTSDFLSLAWSICEQRLQGLELHQTGSNISDNTGLAASAVPLLWLQSLGTTAQTPDGWVVAEKLDNQSDICRKKSVRKVVFLSVKTCVWKRKNCGPGLFAGSLSQNLTPGNIFPAWQQSLLNWLFSHHVTLACQQNVLCQKQQGPSNNSGWACLAGHPSRKQPWKNRKEKKISWRGSALGVEWKMQRCLGLGVWFGVEES